MLKSHVRGVKNGYPLAIEVQILVLPHNDIVSEDNDITLDPSRTASVLQTVNANGKAVIFM